MRGWLGGRGAQAPSGFWVLMVPGNPLLPGGLRVGEEGRATLGWQEAGSTVRDKCQRGARRKTAHHPRGQFPALIPPKRET